MKPLELPEPCPICGKKIFLTEVSEWECVSGKVVSMTTECETEPDIDSDEWEDWHMGHYSMPYVDWLPFDLRMEKWVRERFVYNESELVAITPIHDPKLEQHWNEFVNGGTVDRLPVEQPNIGDRQS